MKKSILSLLLLVSISTTIKPDWRSVASGIGQFARNANANIDREAVRRAAEQEAQEKLARINAQKEVIIKEQVAALKALAQGTWWLVSNSGRIVWNSACFLGSTARDTVATAGEGLQDFEQVANKLNRGDRRAIRGCIGLAIIAALVIYAYNARNNNDAGARGDDGDNGGDAYDHDYARPPAQNPAYAGDQPGAPGGPQ